MKLTEKEQLYLKAKERYYEGDPIMEDWEFDELEAELKEDGSAAIEMVGFKTKGTKVQHPHRMKSLDKIQFQHDYIPYEEFLKWAQKAKEETPVYEAGPKFDGNAVNLIYGEDSKLQKAVTRGDGTEGQDVTDKLRHIVPNQLPIIKGKSFEIRGEVVIPKEVFNTKYKDGQHDGRTYANARNFVAGKLNKDQLDLKVVKDLKFMAFDILDADGNWDEQASNLLPAAGFERFPVLHMTDPSRENFLEVYEYFKHYREEVSPYLLDGIVFKMGEESRIPSMEKDHHPLWALAVKFPAKIGITKILDIEWNVGTTGALVPVAILEPVDLDGSVVKRVILHNFEWAVNNGVGIGAEIEIVKSGDIIPKVHKVLKEGEPIDEMTSYKGLKVIRKGVHLMIEDPSALPEYVIKRMHAGLVGLGIKNVGPALTERIWNAGFTSVPEIFCDGFTEEDLVKSGQFKYGRELELLMQNINKLTEVDLWKIIYSFKFTGCGRTMSKQLANRMAAVDYDFSGLEKAAIDRFSPGSTQTEMVELFKNILTTKGVKIIMPEKIDMGSIGGIFEMTGSPKEHGFKVKADFLNLAKSKGYLHGKLNKDCNFLLTDSMSSSSSKMKKAEKLGVEVITYSDFVEKYLS